MLNVPADQHHLVATLRRTGNNDGQDLILSQVSPLFTCVSFCSVFILFIQLCVCELCLRVMVF